MPYILVTGGTGFIGSHTVVELQLAGYDVVILDNLVNSEISVVDNIYAITGILPIFVRCDLIDKQAVEEVFTSYDFTAVIHFAGLKAVGNSCTLPFVYRYNNIIGTMHLLEIMDTYDVRKLVFSSSATVYDSTQEEAPFREDMRTGHTTNPYATTKHIIEQLLQDMVAWKRMHIISLRYFNPIGAHPSGRIGENPRDLPTNLFPIIMEVLEGRRKELVVYGDDYATGDGSALRDYLHVVDLATSHVVALTSLLTIDSATYSVYNIGRGEGISVLEMIDLISSTLGIDIPYIIGPRRKGDIAVIVADAQKIYDEFGWTTRMTIEDAIQDGWRFRQRLYK